MKSPEELEILPVSLQGLKKTQDLGFKLVIITNQSVIGRGLTTHDQMARINEKLTSELARQGCKIEAVYYCAHRPDENCECRKPAPGLILKAAKELDIDVSKSWMIGDKDIDLEAAQRAGCRGLRVHTNMGDLDDAVNKILAEESLPGDNL